MRVTPNGVARFSYMHVLLFCLVLAAAAPDGDSPATAIVDPQTNESDGVKWEYAYLRSHPCDGDTGWKLQQQSLIQVNNRVYDRLHVVCPTSKVERDFYFDITAYFGRF